MKNVFRSICLAVIFAPVLPAATPPPDYRFKIDVLTENTPQPMELELAPDGRIFFNELNGKLKIYKPGTRDVVVAGSIPVFPEQENGFLGFALDPAFKDNHWIYLYYSPTNFVGQRLSRFSMKEDQLDLASEIKVLEFGEQRRECCHHAGSVEFGPDGNLFISTGDNTNPGGDSDGYAPIDERPGHNPADAQKSAANTHDLRGKILRIRPLPNGTYTIPDGNLFPKDGSAGRPEIFVMGCRNPWRMSVDERTGYVYWGEVGPDAGGDGRRGPRGYDEINQARRAGNFGWPYFVGSNFAYYYFDFATKQLGAKYDPLHPTNNSPNNTGAKVLPPAQPAFIYWPYGESREFPMLGQGGRTACAGPVFHFKPEFKNTGGFPEFYDNCLLFYDWQRPFIKWARLDSDSRLVGIDPFTAAVTVINERDKVNAARARGEFVIQRAVDSQFGPDGCLYLLDYGETWGPNKDSRLLKISYQWGNIAPVAKINADKTAGREPLTVRFSSAGSKDYEGDPLTYEWHLHPGDKVFSHEASATLTVDKPGNYVAEVRVADDKHAVTSANLPLVVGNTSPDVRFLTPQDGDFFTPGKPTHYEILVRDAEDGSSKDYEELFDPRTFVTASWARADGRSEDVEPGLALMKQSDCFNCHSTEQKIVGPPLLEVAKRYRNQPGALDASVERVLKGSTRVWGDVPMLPHESMNPDQVRMMVRWIYGLEPGKSSANLIRGLTGTMKTPSDPKTRFGWLEATYTDAGHPPAGSLSGKARVQLRSRRLEAELADEKHGLKVLGNFLGAINDGHYAKFSNLNLADSTTATLRVASAGTGGTIELRSASPKGDLLGSVEVTPTGSWDKWIELATPIKPTATRTDLYVVFTNPGKGGLMNLDWIQFSP
jgi:cytochrome c